MKKTTRRLMATCMVLGMAAMALGGCSSSKKKVIGVSLPTQDPVSYTHLTLPTT